MKKTGKKHRERPDPHPKFAVSESELARWLWGHMPEEEYRVNTEFLSKMGQILRKDGVWMYPSLGLSIVLEEHADDNGSEPQWSIQRNKPVSFSANYDGDIFYLVLKEQLDKVIEDGVMPDLAFEIEVDSPAFGKTTAICSREFLLSGANPPFCVHTYCLAHGLYGTKQ